MSPRGSKESGRVLQAEELYVKRSEIEGDQSSVRTEHFLFPGGVRDGSF